MSPKFRSHPTMQCFVSLRRIENYLSSPEVSPVAPLGSEEESQIRIALQSATISWPQAQVDARSRSVGVSRVSTPRLAGKFVLHDVSFDIPMGEMTLICGKLGKRLRRIVNIISLCADFDIVGSGKSLLLLGKYLPEGSDMMEVNGRIFAILALLGEADLLAGQIICPRTPPEALALFSSLTSIRPEDWIVSGVCAYVPQTAWLQNASIRANVLFNLPYDEARYQATLEVSSSAVMIHPDLALMRRTSTGLCSSARSENH